MTKLDEHVSRRRKNASTAEPPSSSRNPTRPRKPQRRDLPRNNCSPEADLPEIRLPLGEARNRIPEMLEYATLPRVHDERRPLLRFARPPAMRTERPLLLVLVRPLAEPEVRRTQRTTSRQEKALWPWTSQNTWRSKPPT